MELQDLRAEIDKIDDDLVRLFVRRMEICGRIAAYKKQNNLPVLMPAREQEKLLEVAQKAGPEFSEYAKNLYSCLFELSRDYQCNCTEVV